MADGAYALNDDGTAKNPAAFREVGGLDPYTSTVPLYPYLSHVYSKDEANNHNSTVRPFRCHY